MLNIFRFQSLVKFILEYVELAKHIQNSRAYQGSKISGMTRDNSYLRKEEGRGWAGQLGTSQFIINS